MSRLPRNRILVGDARRVLKRLPDASVDCIVTSPPYYRLRNYQHDKQIGLERHVDDWAGEMHSVLTEAHRLLKPSGSLWLNLGDTFSASPRDGAEPKGLVLAPERVARLLLDSGWLIRNKVIWAKTNPMPSSIKDRLSCTYEVVYFATKSPTYHFDLDAIRVPHAGTTSRSRSKRAAWSVPENWRGPSAGSNGGLDRLKRLGLAGHPLGKNPGDVWHLATAGFRGAHHATFPTELARRPILATCPRWTCSACGLPWIKQLGGTALKGASAPDCECQAPRQPGVVLDPFIGSGTVAVVAEELGRDWIGVEVNPDITALARERIAKSREEGKEPRARAA